MNSKALRRNVILAVIIVFALGMAAGAVVIVQYRQKKDPEVALNLAREKFAEAEGTNDEGERSKLLGEALQAATRSNKRGQSAESFMLLARIYETYYRDTGKASYASKALVNYEAASGKIRNSDTPLRQMADLALEMVEATRHPFFYQKLSVATAGLKKFNPANAASPEILYYEAVTRMAPSNSRKEQARQKIDAAIAAFREKGSTSPLLYKTYLLKLNLLFDEHRPILSLQRRWNDMNSRIESQALKADDLPKVWARRDKYVTDALKAISENIERAELNSMLVSLNALWNESKHRDMTPEERRRRDERFERELSNLLDTLSNEPMQVVEEAMALKGESTQMSIAKARILASYRNDLDGAIRLLESRLGSADLPQGDPRRCDLLTTLAAMTRSKATRALTTDAKLADRLQDKARELYLEAIECAPNNPEPRRELAGFYRQLERYDDAVDQYTRILEIDEDQDVARLALIETLYEQRKYDEAIAQADKIVTTTTHALLKARAWVWKAQALLHRPNADPNAALAQMEPVVEIVYDEENYSRIPRDLIRQLATLQIEAWHKIGSDAMAKQWIDRSGIDYTSSAIEVLLKTDPERALAVIERGESQQPDPSRAIKVKLAKYEALMRMGRPQDAFAILEEVRAIEKTQIPKELDTIRDRIDEKVAKGELSRERGDRAIEVFENRARQFDLEIGLKEYDACLSMYMRNKQEARKARRLARTLSGGARSEQLNLVGEYNDRAERYLDRANQTIEDLQTRHENSLQVAANRIRLMYTRGETDRAVEEAMDLYEEHPKSIPLVFLCAELVWKAGPDKHDDAIALLESLGRERLGNVAVLVGRGEFFERMGKMSKDSQVRKDCFERAIDDYSSALNLDKQLPMLRHRIAALQMALGQSNEQTFEDMPQQAEIQTLLLRTQRLLRENRLAEAEALAEKALEKDAMFPITHVLIGDIADAQKEYAKAIEHYNKAITYNANLHDTRLKLARVLLKERRNGDAMEVLQSIPETFGKYDEALELMAGVYTETNEFDLALQMYDKVLAYVDNPSQVYVRKGQAMARQALQKGDPKMAEQAERLFEQAIEEAGDNDTLAYNASYALGMFYFQMDKPEEARALFTEMTDNYGNEPAAHIQLGHLELSQGKIDRAEKHYRKAVRIDQSNPDPYVQIGQRYMIVGLLDRAYAYAQEALKGSPDSLEAMDLMFQVALRGRNLQQASQVLEKMKDLKPDSPTVMMHEGVLYRERFRADPSNDRAQARLMQGIDLLEKAHAANPDHPKFAMELCTAHRLAGNTDTCVRVLNRFLKRNPNHRSVRLYSARFNIARGEPAAALTDLNKLMEQHPKDPEVNAMLGEVYARLHNLPAARQTYERMHRFSPNQSAWLMRMGTIDLRMKRYDEAARNLQQAYAKSNEQDFASLRGLVECYIESGRPANVPVKVEQYLQGHPKVAPKLLKARLLVHENRDDRALALYRAIVEDHPEQVAGWRAFAGFYEKKAHEANERARQAMRIGRTAQAARHRRDAVTLMRSAADVLGRAVERFQARQPTYAMQLNAEKARLLVEAGRTKQSFAIFEKLLGRNDLPTEYRHLLINNYAYYLARYGDKDNIARALELIGPIKNIDNRNFGMLDTAGYVYLQSGDLDQALNFLQLALDKNTEVHRKTLQENTRDPAVKIMDILPCIHYHLGLAYKAKNETDKARAHFAKALEADKEAENFNRLTDSEWNDCTKQLTILQ